MMSAQPGILQPQRPFARYITGRRRIGIAASAVRDLLLSIEIDEQLILGLGPGLSRYLNEERPELRSFPALSGAGVEVPSTQADLWLWVNCDAPGLAITHAHDLMLRLGSLFEFDTPIEGFKHGETQSGLGRDLTGYEDGTENPQGDDATAAALSADGSSFVAVQTWKHDLAHFASFSQAQQDNMIGRRRADNEELDDAPPSAHVKRTAQESFTPEAWLLRRSLPWAGSAGEGLMFVAFGRTFDAFEVQMRRMAGLDDGILDACFDFSRPISGGYYWCPPVVDGHLLLN
jgi:putative iron-dependent peroxidase